MQETSPAKDAPGSVIAAAGVAATRTPVVDLDGHVIEPYDMWERYIEAPFKACAPRRAKDSWGMDRLMVESRLFPTPEGPGRAPRYLMTPDRMAEYRERLRGGWDPNHRLRDMDREGIDVALLLPSQGLVIGAVRDPRLAAAISRAYNDWLADYCRTAPERLLGAAMLPFQDVAAAVVEARRAVTELGFRAVFARPNPIAERTLADPDYDPLYAEIERLEVPLQVHEGCGFSPGATVGIDRFENGLMSHMISHTCEIMIASLTIICGGVLERFPGLRVAFMEGGGSWMPYWLERMDDHASRYGWEVPWLRMPPSEYFRRQCVVGCDLGEAGLPYLVERLGAERVAFSSDYPHSDHEFPSVPLIRDRRDLSDEAKRAILGGNAARLLKIAKVPAR